VSAPCGRALLAVPPENERNQRRNLLVLLDRVPEWLVRPDVVAVATADAPPLEVAALLKVEHDALHGALGNPDEGGHVAHPDLRLARQAQQHVRVIGQKRPGRLRRSRLDSHPVSTEPSHPSSRARPGQPPTAGGTSSTIVT
jgi:hypothetical protein